jgi:hypothetical protein
MSVPVVRSPWIVPPNVITQRLGNNSQEHRADGTKFEGRLVAKTADGVTVEMYRRRTFRRPERIGTETLALADVRDIKKPLSGTQRALIVAGVAVGACAVAASLVTANLESEPNERAGRPDAIPANDDTDLAPAPDAPPSAAP